ncbi:MAG TPA: ricin-type beta-trefoil lectin domain protein, partial [Streptosporangiaceae bacterium]
ENAYDGAFNHPGVAITVASGDSGYGTQYPAVSPFVTAVGGTSLHKESDAWVQAAWEGAGSGCSTLEPQPSWQQTGTAPLDGCLNRTEADVSATADPGYPVAVYDTFPGLGVSEGWNGFGGTSVATPIVAAIYALAGNPTTGTYPASYLYQNTSHVTDITSGPANGVCEPARQYLCNAETGYDGPTGWGTPDGTVAFDDGGSGEVVTVEDPGTQDYRVGSTVGLWLTGHDSESQPLSYTASGLPAGLAISTSGLISGTPTSAGAATVTVTATSPGPASGSVTFALMTVPSLRTSFHPVSGPVRFSHFGQCLDDRHNAAWNGNRVQVWTCNGKSRQSWKYLPGGDPGGPGTLIIHGKCLRQWGWFGARAVLWTCNGAVSERWFLAGFGLIVNKASGKCLAGPQSRANGVQLRLRGCDLGSNQTWQPPASPVPSGVAGKCMNDKSNAAVAGNPVTILTCDGSERQNWAARDDGTIRIHRLCLGVSGFSPLNGAAIELESCNDLAFRMLWVPGPRGELVNGLSGKCLADPGSSSTDGRRLRQEDCYGNAGEIWALS